ncbi:MAG: translesion error-prone DNA polymerase V autoproteolytic subunit [candidate division Zixibacteria bacterium]|nr:translesion error-prone DNA polymerase V autoproteolytic subunit [candidate division Zixibacteria bacterium]
MAIKTHTVGPRLSVCVLAPVSAGFPSAAGDYLETRLDLNELLIARPASTFFVRVRGESMAGARIRDGDLLVVDRSLEAISGDIVVAVVHGEFTVKRFVRTASTMCLEPANSAYRTITIDAESETEIWGVVSYVIHKTR